LLTGLSIAFVVGLVLWAVLWHNSSILYETITHGDRSGAGIALTFDDGPHPDYTARTLDLLAAHGVKATFFCLGSLVEQYPSLVRRMHAEGHLVASHGFDHSLADFFRPPASAHRSILESGSRIRDITGYFPRFYRPPVGIKTPPRLLSAYRLGLAWAGWARQAADGGYHVLSPDKAASLIRATRPGDVLLLHDGRIGRTCKMLDPPPASLETYQHALDILLTGLKGKGLECVRLDHLSGLTPGLPDTPAAEGFPSSWRLVKARLTAAGHEQGSPAWMGLSLGVGVLIGCSPFFGLHAFLAMVVALRFRLHKLAALTGTAISNPPLTPLLILGCLQTGWWCVHRHAMPMSLETLRTIGLAELVERFLTYWLIGLPLFGLAVAVVAGLAFTLVLSLRHRARPNHS
jgi:peptidoglycan/xylan/chitin deacetylase (PgdA/CDA1 family)/uncharacterized protein (DUF2062 family)